MSLSRNLARRAFDPMVDDQTRVLIAINLSLDGVPLLVHSAEDNGSAGIRLRRGCGPILMRMRSGRSGRRRRRRHRRSGHQISMLMQLQRRLMLMLVFFAFTRFGATGRSGCCVIFDGVSVGARWLCASNGQQRLLLSVGLFQHSK